MAKGKNFGQRMAELRIKKLKEDSDRKLLECFLPQPQMPDMNNKEKPLPKPVSPETYIEAVTPSPSQTMMDRAIQSLREKTQGL